MKSRRLIWACFSLCLALLLGVMGWLTKTVLWLDGERLRIGREAAFEETVRLALWRLEAITAPIVVQESNRPWFMYQSFYPADRIPGAASGPVRPGDSLFPSALLSGDSPFVALHFQFGSHGVISSPQVPTSEALNLVRLARVPSARIAAYSERLAAFGRQVSVKLVAAGLPDVAAASAPVEAITLPRPEPAERVQQATRTPNQTLQQIENSQAMISGREWRARSQNVAQMKALPQQLQAPATAVSAPGAKGFRPAPTPRVEQGPTSAFWAGNLLLVARKVRIGDEITVQGAWLDWPALRTRMLETIRDILPAASLSPAEPAARNSQARILAALPVRLDPGPNPAASVDAHSPLRLALGVAWVAVILATLTVGVVLHGAMVLSERRSAFASAVTHELRTPLTTFRMYSEMLAEGMVSNEDQQREYLRTLSREADRLGMLVENVLTYSRLEKKRAGALMEIVPLADLAARHVDRLLTRAESDGMHLVISNDAPPAAKVRVDQAGIERILFNLVDNACKYAATGSDRTINLTFTSDRKNAVIAVTDNGPGISAIDARRLFRPFTKLEHDASRTAPGIGLGLNLSRRLARGMGGDLRLDRSIARGASFVLTLPLI